MSNLESSSPELLRVFFRGGSKLDEAMRNARPMARMFLLRRLAEEGWRLQQLGAPLPVDPADWAKDLAGGATVSVRFELDGESPMALHLRSLPRGGRTAQLFRIETIRALAAAGLAYQGRQQAGAADPTRPAPTFPSNHVIDSVAAPSGEQHGDKGDYSHLPFGRLADEVTLA